MKNLNAILMRDKNVCVYTKLLILISQMNYFGKHDISNTLIVRRLGITKAYAIRTLNKMKQNGIIKINYNGPKRYITLCNYDYIVNFEPFTDDWLNGDL